MEKIVAYLTFDGRCEEAMNFYKKCIGGELNLMRAAGSPMETEVPQGMKEKIIHSSLTKGNLELFAMDSFSPGELVTGNAISLSIECENEAALRKLVLELSEGGKIIMPVEKPFWGGFYAMLTDKYGIRWMLSSPE